MIPLSKQSQKLQSDKANAREGSPIPGLRQKPEAVIHIRLKNVVEREFRRLSYTEAVELLKASGKTFEFPVEWGHDLQAEHERYLTEA